MTMDAMVDYLEARGFKAERKYDPSIKKYKFTIEKEDHKLTSWFEYPSWARNDIVKNQRQREFLDGMIKQFEKEAKSDALMTKYDMREYLVRRGISVASYEQRNSIGQHEIHFSMMKNGRTLHRILNEYNIGGLTEIQRYRRYFLEEIVEAFEYEERREKELKCKTIDLDIRDLYPETMYVSDIINKIIHEKEKDEMKFVEWKVANVDITNRGFDAPDVEVKLRAYYKPNGGSICVDPIRLTEMLNAKLNDRDPAPNCRCIPVPSTKLPQIEKVIFNNPATIIIWKDETKTVVKCQEGDSFDPEKGFAMAIVKKALGNQGNYCETVKKWVGDTDHHSASWLATQRLYNALGDKKATKADLKFAMEEAIKYLEGNK